MIKLNYAKIIKIVKFFATVITSIAGTLAVQSCGQQWF